MASLLVRSESAASPASQFVVMESEVDGTERQFAVDAVDTKDKARARVLSTLSLLALGFFATFGGPISSESLITGAGVVSLFVWAAGSNTLM